MTKRIGILVEFNYEDLEVWYPLLRFREEGMVTCTIGPVKGKDYLSKKGYPCKADMGIDEVKTETAISSVGCHCFQSKRSQSDLVHNAFLFLTPPQEFDALIIPGGFAPDYWRRDQRFVNLVKDIYQSGKPTAAICHGPWMFCSAKILAGKKATCFYSIKDDLTNAGAIYEDKEVVVDGNMITSRTPQDLPHFCKAILTQLLK